LGDRNRKFVVRSLWFVVKEIGDRKILILPLGLG